MAYALTLHARRNGRRLAQDSSGETGEFDIHSLAAWAQTNLTPEEIGRVIWMLQRFLDKPDDDTDASKLGEDARRRGRQFAHDASADASKSFLERFPEAARIKQAL
jgi:hypothetical protein